MNVLDEARGLIYGERHSEYGPAGEEFKRVADGWSAIIGADVTATDVALGMAYLKIVRESYKHKRDNIVDAIGYLALAQDIEEAQGVPSASEETAYGASGTGVVPASEPETRPTCPNPDGNHYFVITRDKWPWEHFSTTQVGACAAGHSFTLIAEGVY